MLTSRWVVLLGVAAWLSCGAMLTGATEVTVRFDDVDACGEPEIVMENRCLRVDLFTGQSPSAPPRSWLDRVLRRAPAPVPPRYNCRFVGPGWIANVVFRPTGRRWLAATTSGAEAWCGIPEEFEEAVRVREISPGVWRCLKVGVGLCQGTGWCFRGSLTPIDPGVWQTSCEDLPEGGKAVTFRQTISVEEGYGYSYEKRLVLRPGDSRLVIERTLTNTGEHELRTSWYTHAFWGQAGNGAYDDSCWATLPLRRGPGAADGVGLDTTACPISNPARAYYWGPVDREWLGDAWYACGNHEGSEVFLTMLPEIPAFYRVWTCPQTYSLEPFRLIRLLPGAREHWVEALACGTGLDRIDTHDGVAAYGSTVSAATEDVPARCALRVVPFCELTRATLRLELRFPDGSKRVEERLVASAAPDQPFVVSLDDVADRLPVDVDVRLDVGATGAPAAPMGRTGHLRIAAPPGAVADALPPHANGAPAVILGPFERNATGSLTPNGAAGLLQEYLGAAGFVPVLARDRDGLPALDGACTALVACVGLRVLPVDLWRQLEAFVRAGGGLLVCGPIDPAAFEFTDLLPLRAVTSTVRAGAPPRDGTREFVRAYATRYQLAAVVDHAALRGLPFFPRATQDIGVLQTLEPEARGLTVLRYRTPAGLLPEVSSAALVVASYGAGRVAVLASPVDWGIPSGWCLWSRLGEYHRQFFSQVALWAAEPTLSVPGSTPPSSDCESRAVDD